MAFSFRAYWDGFIGLIYPKLCIACNQETSIKGDDFCLNCYPEFPFTTHFEIADNDFMYHFYGRVKVIHGAALFNYYKANMTEGMIHRLKYEGKKRIGERLGTMLGQKMIHSTFFKEIDIIVPVPIHRKKALKRGYNQSEIIANALAKVLGVEVNTNVLLKTKVSETQTQKSRSERSKDLLNTMELRSAKTLMNKHVLLVDDVMTTGATLEACALKLSEIEGVQLSMASLAITKNK